MRKPSVLGKGKNMSIPKAGLVLYYKWMKENILSGADYIYSGDLNFVHAIVEIAGAKHCGPNTCHQVLSRLNSSPYWEANFQTTGWGGSRALCYRPSAKGEAFFNKSMPDADLKKEIIDRYLQ